MGIFGKKKDKPCDKAVVTNVDKSEGDTPVTAFFDLHARRTSNWVEGVKKDLQKRFQKVEVKVDENPFEGFGNQLSQLTPMSIMNAGMKSQIKSQLKANADRIVLLFVEAGIYCAVFHHAKQGLKRVTKDRKIGPAVQYTCDIMMPDGLYGPPIGFLIRLNLPF